MKGQRFNSAQRLLEIVELLKSSPQENPIWEVYLAVYGNGSTKDDALMFAYELAKLANHIEETIKTSDKVTDELLKNLRPIFDQCHELNLERPWKQCVGRLRPEAVVALQAYANFFTAVCNEERLSKEQYEELDSGIKNLFTVVDKCNHEELRDILSSILESARRAIALYKINGAKPFSETFDLTVGKLCVLYQREKFSKKENKETVDMVVTFVGKMKQYCSAAKAVLALASDFENAKKTLGLE